MSEHCAFLFAHFSIYLFEVWFCFFQFATVACKRWTEFCARFTLERTSMSVFEVVARS